jgi:hypothetical protein
MNCAELRAVRQVCERRTEAWWPCVYVADSDIEEPYAYLIEFVKTVSKGAGQMDICECRVSQCVSQGG